MQMDDKDITVNGTPRWRLVIDAVAIGAAVSLAGGFLWLGQWKAQQERNDTQFSEQIEFLTDQVRILTDKPITVEADRRLSVAESRIVANTAAVSDLKVDLNKRLDRLESQNDTILNELRRSR